MRISAIILGLALVAAATPAFAQSSVNALASAEKAIAEVKEKFVPDKRQAVFEVKPYMDTDGRLVVGGKVSEAPHKAALVEALDQSATDYADSVIVLPDTLWGQVRIAVACLRTRPGHASEMATQAIMGTPLRLLEKEGEWWRVQSPDGYISYVVDNSIREKSTAEMARWRSANRFVVTDPYQIRAYRNSRDIGVRDVVTDLVNGCIVEQANETPVLENGKLLVRLPDGRTGYVDAKALAPVEEWAAQSFDPKKILDLAYSMEGTPYLWGGMSPKSLDCSGLVKVCYFANGLILRRDASQQALTGQRIEAQDWRRCHAGDLLFFGNAKTGRVTHVAIYDHDGHYVHSSGMVKRNSVDPEDPSYLTTPFLHAVRIQGSEETPGITRARNHPWYF